MSELFSLIGLDQLKRLLHGLKCSLKSPELLRKATSLLTLIGTSLFFPAFLIFVHLLYLTELDNSPCCSIPAMHLVLSVLVSLALIDRVASQILPGVSCASGYSSTIQQCPTSNEADCAASTCTTAGNYYSQCQTVNGQLYCAVCCPNTVR